MNGRSLVLSAAAAAVSAPACAPQGLSPALLSSSAFREQEVVQPDGRIAMRLTPATQLAPGDRVLFVLTLRNIGARPTAGVVVTNPLPFGVAYAGAREGGAPAASVDGRLFAPLADLRVPGPEGETPACMDDVRALRWAIPGCIPPDGEVRLSYRGRLRA